MNSNRALALAALLAVLAAPGMVRAQPRPATPAPPPAGGAPAPPAAGGAAATGPVYNCVKNPKGVTVSFGKTELELQDLLDWAMTFSCKNFIYQGGIAGRTSKVVLMSPKKLSPAEAWEVFLTALNTMGLALVDKGATLRIVESTEIKKQALPIRRGGVGNDDQMVRAIIRPQHVTADDLAAALNAMTSKDGLVTTLPKANLVLVTDYASHITPMRSLVRDLDRAQSGDGLYVIKLQYADVTEVAQTVNDLLGVRAAGSAPASSGAPPPRRGRGDAAAGGGSAPTGGGGDGEDVAVAVPTKVIAETRTNSLIILASEAAYLRVRALVKALDVPVAVEGGGRIHVYYLENADAEELGTTMTSVISGITQPSGGAAAGGNRPQRPAAAPGGAPGAGSNEGPAFEGQVRVTHDKPTNSLVVVASVKDFLAVREVIRKLDIPRRQVFIEAVILEVSANMARDLGFSWHGGATLDDGAIALGGLQHTQLRSLNVATLATSTGLLGGVIGPLLEGAEELLGTSIPSFGILFQALATNSNVNVLSSPHILTTDNEPAEISVGQNIPYQSSVSNVGQGTGQTPGFGFPLQSIQRQDVALTLKITPHINASDMVRMEIDQEISDIADPDFNGNGPSWSKRTIKTTVVARDQQSIVLGGLMADRQTRNESKIPLLGDIPILGYLFKYEQTTKTKTNLLILLTPYVIKDQMDIEELVQRKVRERQEFVRAFANFRRMGYRSGIDYRRKRGLLAEINHVVTEIEIEEALLKELERKDEQFPDGRIEYDLEPPDETDDETPAPPAPAPAPPPPTMPGPRP